MLKGRDYFNNPQTIEELEQNVRNAVAAISTDIDEATQQIDILTSVIERTSKFLRMFSYVHQQ